MKKMKIKRMHLFWGVFAALIVVFFMMEGFDPSMMKGTHQGRDLLPSAGRKIVFMNEAEGQVGPSGFVNAQMVNLKGTPLTLYGGPITVSTGVSSVNAINMTNYMLGQLQVISAGSNQITLAFYTSEDAVNYVIPNYYTGSAWAAYPSVITSTGSSYSLPSVGPGMMGKWLKIVPTISGGTNPITVIFTPGY